MDFSSHAKKKRAYIILRSYKEAVKNIKASGREPSIGTLKRIAEIQTFIRKYSNGQVTK
tara:strand:+ start:358 stop:534 length:177 start_codon:yes stop_codon:yes gene_type:complete